MAALRAQFRERTVEKAYLAIAIGRLEGTGVVEADLAPDPAGHRDAQHTVPKGEGMAARTEYSTLELLGPCTLVECRPRTGRRHQIRVHLALLGHPIVADRLYGPGAVPIELGEAPQLTQLDRHALHSSRVSLRHPGSGAACTFEAPLAPDMALLLEWLRGRYGSS